MPNAFRSHRTRQDSLRTAARRPAGFAVDVVEARNDLPVLPESNSGDDTREGVAIKPFAYIAVAAFALYGVTSGSWRMGVACLCLAVANALLLL